jgi:hypothetical protein
LVEHHVANVTVAGSSPVSRSRKGGIAKWLRQRSAKPFDTGSNPVAASTCYFNNIAYDFQKTHHPIPSWSIK